jgi:hypothetical protein
MADEMRPTPRSPILGLFSDIVNLPLQYMSSPERTQQMQGTAQFLYGTGIPKTLERMSYGDSLFSGSGMTLRPKEETINAAMNVAPFAPAAGRLASRTVRATEGLPVGMSIKDVGKSAITREGNPIQSAVVLVGDKIFMGRTHGDALNRAVYEGVVRKEGGKYIFPKGAEVNSDLFMTKDGQIIDRLQASKMFDIGASETAIEKGLMQNNPPKSMTVDSYIEEATALKKQREQSPYPQQAALDLAQQRAALPVEQGGLGLPANNTAADRAKAMGFDTDLLHGTARDFPAFDLSKAGTNTRQAGDELGIFSTSKPFLANDYAQIASRGGWANRTTPENAVVYPLVGNFQNPKKYETASQFYRDADAMAADQNLGNWRRQLQGQGYDSVFVRPDLEEVVAFSPDQLRSRFAAFDPFRKDVATATAMGVALPDLLAQPVNQYQPTYETIPMYTDPFGNTIGSSIR